MSQNFHIIVNGKQEGPFTIEQLKSKGLQRDTLVWTEGLDNWTKAEHVALLNDLLRSMPPPMPSNETKVNNQQMPPPPIPNINSDLPYFGFELARRRERLFATIVEAIVVSIPLMIVFGSTYYENDPFTFESILGSALFSALLGAIFYPMWGGNLGHKIMGLCVISSENGEVQTDWKVGAKREAIKGLVSWLFIPAVWLLWDENKQNLYDKAVKTYVVKKK
jgi:uncharacterized RDD family membrane protein YckC